MKAILDDGRKVDLDHPLDISIPVKAGENGVRAWYLPAPSIEPVRSEDFIGSVEEGGPVNFRNITFNPHGHGTHTEGPGHITENIYSINDALDRRFFLANLISVTPSDQGEEGHQIMPEQIEPALSSGPEALIIRTLPNPKTKLVKQYSHTDPPFMAVEAIERSNQSNVRHLLIDLPSVDREKDGGKLAAHKAFWGTGDKVAHHKTITEFIYVPDHIPDGTYLLDLQVAPIDNDAAPSRPLLYPLSQ